MITVNNEDYEVSEIIERLYLSKYGDNEDIDNHELDEDGDFSLSEVNGIFDKNWNSMEEVFEAILEKYRLRLYYFYHNGQYGLVSKEMEDNYGLGDIRLKIYDEDDDMWRVGDLNSLFGFNYDIGRFDSECNRIWDVCDYMTYHDIIDALTRDDTRTFSSFDEFVEFVETNKGFTFLNSLKMNIINSDKCATHKLIDFLNDILNASECDAINTNADEHNALISFVDDIKKCLKKK